MALGHIGKLGGGSECESCGDVRCSPIRCDDDSYLACFENKCLKITVSGWSNNGDCTLCSSANGVVYARLHTWELEYPPDSVVPCELVFYGYSPATPLVGVSGRMSFPAAGYPAMYASVMPVCDGVPPYLGEPTEIGNFRKWIAAEGEPAADYLAHDEWFLALCHGDEVTIPFDSMQYPHGYNDALDYCVHDGTAMKLQLVDDSECVAAEPNSYDCVSGVCTKVKGSSGEFATLAACLADSCGEPDCNTWGWTDCDSYEALQIDLSGFADCSIPDNDGDHDFLEQWKWSNLNGQYTLDHSDDVDPSELQDCTTAAGEYFYLPLGNFYAVDWEDRYADPGILLRVDTTDGSHKDEYYIYGIGVSVDCYDEGLRITSVCILYTLWRWLWTGSAFDEINIQGGPSGYNTSESFACTATATATPVLCTTGGRVLRSSFDYDKCGTTSTAYVRGVIGSVS